MLEVKNVSVHYDTAVVLDGVSFVVNEGELVNIVGPNGAGKTTLLRAIAGLVKWDQDTLKRTTLANITFEGSIIFKGEEVKGLPSPKIAKKGLILSPERGRPFRELTVLDNLKAGAYLCKDQDMIKSNLEKVLHLFPRLKERQNQLAGTLSGGERTMLSVGRTLMYQPELLLIDEPSTGLAPKLKEDLFTRLKEIFQMGITILLVEQDVSFAFDLANRNYVLSQGHIVGEGTKDSLLADDLIRRTYLGL